MYFVKLYYPGNVDAKKTLLPAAYASCRGITISMAVKDAVLHKYSN
jgi:hypothetical protein